MRGPKDRADSATGLSKEGSLDVVRAVTRDEEKRIINAEWSHSARIVVSFRPYFDCVCSECSQTAAYSKTSELGNTDRVCANA